MVISTQELFLGHTIGRRFELGQSFFRSRPKIRTFCETFILTVYKMKTIFESVEPGPLSGKCESNLSLDSPDKKNLEMRLRKIWINH